MELIISGKFEPIATEPDFYHAKAQEAWNKWKGFPLSDSQIAILNKMDYMEFRNSDNPLVVKVRELIFKVVAYADSKACDKNVLNDYSDNRTIAQSGIRQDKWVKQLIRYKSNPENISNGIRNFINYIENPEKCWPIISENHKKLIYEYYVGEKYNPTLFNSGMDKALGKYWVGKNNANRTCYLTGCIYDMATEWNPIKNDDTPIKGLFVHETDDNWKEGLQSSMIDRKGCIWWHKQPANYKTEILNKLDEIISSGETFEFYYIKNNCAYYRAIVSDFATENAYDDKKVIWEEYSPVGFENKFDYYEDDREHSASIVFLIDKFERLNNPIPLEYFRRYKDMTYNQRTGMAAFSSITTKEEFEKNARLEKYRKTLLAAKNVVFTGAPGTGKTHLAHELAAILNATTEMVQFHPSFDYTDFVEGLRPTSDKSGNGNIKFSLQKGIFKSFCEKALVEHRKSKEEGQDARPFVFIIDEINRGDISKIFGELFFALDPNYRGDKYKVKTQYQNMIDRQDPFYEGFFIPENVYIIGTMNDIDRGVENIDFAFRRRFLWLKINASDTIEMLSQLDNLKDGAIVHMNALNKAISEMEPLSDDYHIGAAYFLKLAQFKDEPDLYDRLWEYYLEPLLREYLRGVEDAEEKLKSLNVAYGNA